MALNISEISIHLSSLSPWEVMGWCCSSDLDLNYVQSRRNCPLDHTPERWLWPQFQTSSPLSVWACFLLTAISFCAHTTSGSHLGIYFFSWLALPESWEHSIQDGIWCSLSAFNCSNPETESLPRCLWTFQFLKQIQQRGSAGASSMPRDFFVEQIYHVSEVMSEKKPSGNFSGMH